MTDETNWKAHAATDDYVRTRIDATKAKILEPWLGRNQGSVPVDDIEAQGGDGGTFANRFTLTHDSSSDDDHAYRYVASVFECYYLNQYDYKRLKIDLSAHVDQRHLAVEVLDERALFPSHLSGYLVNQSIVEVLWDGDTNNELRHDADWLKIGENSERISYLRLEERVNYDAGDKPLAHPSLPYWHHNRLITCRPTPLGGWLKLRIRLVTGINLTVDDFKIRATGGLSGKLDEVIIKPV